MMTSTAWDTADSAEVRLDFLVGRHGSIIDPTNACEANGRCPVNLTESA
jgi:hypothetical protein